MTAEDQQSTSSLPLPAANGTADRKIGATCTAINTLGAIATPREPAHVAATSGADRQVESHATVEGAQDENGAGIRHRTDHDENNRVHAVEIRRRRWAQRIPQLHSPHQ